MTIVRWQHLPLFTYERMHVEDRRLVCNKPIHKCWPKVTMLQNYFCDGLCQQKSSHRNRAEIAFRTLVTDYLVVGTSDNLELFMKCLEILMPKYFRGVNVDYQNSKSQLWNEFKTSFKRKLNSKTTFKLEQLLDTDIEFYQRVRQWFHKTCNLYV